MMVKKIVTGLLLCCTGFLFSCTSLSNNLVQDQEEFVAIKEQKISLDAKPDKVSIYKSGGLRDLNVHIFFSDNATDTNKVPAVILYYGGGFNKGSPSQFYLQAQYLSQNGFTVILPEYRVWSIDRTPPNVSLMDAKSAYRWVVKKADTLNIDVERIAVGGGSAGGYLAAAVATVPGFNDKEDEITIGIQPKHLLLLNPLLDASKNRVNRPYGKLMSPFHNVVEGHPGTLIMTGDKDKVTPLSVAEKYRDKVIELGSSARLVVYPNAGHGFFNYKKSSAFFIETTVLMSEYLEAEL